MSYDPNTRKITAPVSIYDVQQALGTSHSDVRSLCESGNVNKWSKYKPVPLFGFYLNMEEFNNITYGEKPSPPLHQPRGDWEDLQKWYWGNLWAWDTYGLWRNVIQISGYNVPRYNIASMWVPTMDVDNSNDCEYNSADPRNYSGTFGYRSCYKYKDATIAKLAAILQGIAADMNAYNYKQFLHSDITQQVRDNETFVYRLTDFKNYSHIANQPLHYTYPLSLVSGSSAVFSVDEVVGNLELDEIMHAASDIAHGLPVLVTAIHVICINGNVAKMFGTQWGMSGTTAGVFNDANYNENVLKSTFSSDPKSAQVTVAVNDMGNSGDNVTLFLVATLYNYVSAPEGEAGSITVVKNVILPMQDDVMPRTLKISGSNPDALEMFQLLYEAGGSQKSVTLYMPIEDGTGHTRQEVDGVVTLCLLNTENVEHEVDLEVLRMRWTWAGLYATAIGSMGMIATDIWVNSEDDVLWADNPTGLGEQLTYTYNHLYASEETHAAKRVLWSYTNSQAAWSNNFYTVSYNETLSNQPRRLAKIKIPAGGRAYVSYKLQVMDTETKYGVPVANLHSIFENQYIIDTGEAREQQTGHYEIIQSDLYGQHGNMFYYNAMILCLENTVDNNPTKRIELDAFYAESLPYHYIEYGE